MDSILARILMSKYKCESHKLDLCCLGCVRAWIARHEAMKDFITLMANSTELFYSDDAQKILDLINK